MYLESLHARFDAIPSDSPEKRIVMVKLEKDEQSGSGIGVELAGGARDGAGDGASGVFVASVIPGGSAHRDGRLKVGDRIVSINGRSTEGKQLFSYY